MFDEYIWSQKYRPKTLNDIVIDSKTRSYFADLISQSQIPNLMLSGNPGVGKTTLAKVLVNELKADHLYINASDEAGVDTIRSKVIGFSETRSLNGGIKIVILDEADGLSGVVASGRASAQQALRNVMEEYSENTRFILTANYPSKIIPALHSRCQHVDLIPPLQECAKFCFNILVKEGVKYSGDDKKQLGKLIKSRYPDMRKIINSLQQSTVDGVLTIGDDSERLFVAQKVIKMLHNKKPMKEIRKFIIQNEAEFQDYHDLLTDLFEVVFESDLEEARKAEMLLIITEAMYRHTIVMDQEINCFSAIIQLLRV